MWTARAPCAPARRGYPVARRLVRPCEIPFEPSLAYRNEFCAGTGQIHTHASIAIDCRLVLKNEHNSSKAMSGPDRSPNHAPVLIAGGGPVGMTLAVDLAQKG